MTICYSFFHVMKVVVSLFIPKISFCMIHDAIEISLLNYLSTYYPFCKNHYAVQLGFMLSLSLFFRITAESVHHNHQLLQGRYFHYDPYHNSVYVYTWQGHLHNMQVLVSFD